METVTWLWLYDKRWMFGCKAPNLLKIWAAPLFFNALFLGSLLYYSYYYRDDTSNPCYSKFRVWIDFRTYLLIALVIDLTWIWLKASKKIETEDHKLGIHHKANINTAKKYNYWLRRRLVISYSGLMMLMLGVMNWIWTFYGMNLMYYNPHGLDQCGMIQQNIVWGNLVLTGIFSFPIIWILFWMIIIKSICLVLSVVWPSALIFIKKCTA